MARPPAHDEEGSAALRARDIGLLRAGNPGPFTLDGTNTWVVGRDPCWIVDPGPALDDHLDAVAAEAHARGGAAGIAVTHHHLDHVGGLPGIRARLPGVPVAAAQGTPDVLLTDGAQVGPLRVLATGGHAPDHVMFVAGDVAFTGDAVLGRGSVFIAPGPGSLRGYLDALDALRASGPALLCPGHGPVIRDAVSRLARYVEHRRDRERWLLAALDDGLRSADELVDRVWPDAPPALRRAAAVTLAAHLGKLDEEGLLPPGVEIPQIELRSTPEGG